MPNPTLDDFWQGKATFQVDDALHFGAGFAMNFLSVWRDADRYWTFYVTPSGPDRPDLYLAVGLALGEHAQRFANQGIVLDRGGPDAWDSRMASFAGVWRDAAGAWTLVYEGAGLDARWPGDVGLATSPDGKTWTKQPAPILLHSVPQKNDPDHQDLSWERQAVGTPSLWREGDTWYLFYHGYGKRAGSPDDCQLGVAVGKDLSSFARYPGNPILRTSDTGGWDCGTIGKRSIRKEGSYYHMVYEGSTEQPYTEARWSCGLARSKDLLAWEKYPRPVLPQTKGGMGYDCPEWVETPDGRLHIYFRNQAGCTSRATLVRMPG